MARLPRRSFLALGLGALAVGCRDQAPPSPGKAPPPQARPNEAPAADLVVARGTILTLDPERPTADALAIKDGKVLALGTRDEIDKMRSASTKNLDLKGGVAIPGLVVDGIDLVEFGRELGDAADPTTGSLQKWIEAAQDDLIRRGITAVRAPGIDAGTDRAYRALADTGRLKLRVHGEATATWFETALAGKREPDACPEQARYCLGGVRLGPDAAGGLAKRAADRGWRVVSPGTADPPDPLHRVHARLTAAEGPAASVEVALREITTDAAAAVGRSAHLGAIAVGMQADLTCFRADLRELDPAALRTTGAYATVVGGVIVYRG